jgi:hypothetical protein
MLSLVQAIARQTPAKSLKIPSSATERINRSRPIRTCSSERVARVDVGDLVRASSHADLVGSGWCTARLHA